MEKWKIAVIVALLAGLPAYSYIQSGAMSASNSSSSPTQSPSEALGEKPAKDPPPYLLSWWGKKPPAFSFPKELWVNTPQPISLENMHGKVVLLELWREECPHCQESVPLMEELAQQHKAAGLQIVGVHCSAAKNTIEYKWPELQTWIKDHGIKYPVAFDEKRSVFNLFKAQKYPTLMIIDRQGVIRYAHEGMTPPLQRELIAALDQVLAGKNPEWPPSKAVDAAAKYAPDAKP
jgi:peroxiredoxin